MFKRLKAWFLRVTDPHDYKDSYGGEFDNDHISDTIDKALERDEQINKKKGVTPEYRKLTPNQLKRNLSRK